MPKVERWDKLPAGVRQHLITRMQDRAISLDDLNRLRLWIESEPDGHTERNQVDGRRPRDSCVLCAFASLRENFSRKVAKTQRCPESPAACCLTENKRARKVSASRALFFLKSLAFYSVPASPVSCCCFRRSSRRLARSAARFTSSLPTSSSIAVSAPSPLRQPSFTTRV